MVIWPALRYHRHVLTSYWRRNPEKLSIEDNHKHREHMCERKVQDIKEGVPGHPHLFASFIYSSAFISISSSEELLSPPKVMLPSASFTTTASDF